MSKLEAISREDRPVVRRAAELRGPLRLVSGAGGETAVDAAKVARLREAIATGTFRVDPRLIAERLAVSLR